MTTGKTTSNNKIFRGRFEEFIKFTQLMLSQTGLKKILSQTGIFFNQYYRELFFIANVPIDNFQPSSERN